MADVAAVKIVMGPDVTSTVERTGCIVQLQQKCAILLYSPWTKLLNSCHGQGTTVLETAILLLFFKLI